MPLSKINWAEQLFTFDFSLLTLFMGRTQRAEQLFNFDFSLLTFLWAERRGQRAELKCNDSLYWRLQDMLHFSSINIRSSGRIGLLK